MLQYRMLKNGLFCFIALLPITSWGDTGAMTVLGETQITHSTQSSAFMHDFGWNLRPMTESEFTSSMCVLGATTSLALTYMVGPNEIIMLVVGGVVVPSAPSVLFVSLFGTMAAAGCTIGASSTPAISWLYHFYNGTK